MDLTLWQITILAIVQGATEFLPISSSGHLTVLAAVLSPDGTTEGLDIIDLNIVLHGGTLVSILVYYGHQIQRLMGPDRRTISLLAVGTVPAAVLGPLVKEYGKSTLDNPLLAGCLLPITGLILIWASRRDAGKMEYPEKPAATRF